MDEKERYVKLVKKYKGLPDLNWLEENFGVTPEEGNVLVQVRISLVDKMEHIGHSIIEPLIYRADSYCCFFEKKMINGSERDSLFRVYKEIQSLVWESHVLSVNWNEERGAKWLINSKKMWDERKVELGKIFEKLAKGWRDYKHTEVSTAYHG